MYIATALSLAKKNRYRTFPNRYFTEHFWLPECLQYSGRIQLNRRIEEVIKNCNFRRRITFFNYGCHPTVAVSLILMLPTRCHSTLLQDTAQCQLYPAEQDRFSSLMSQKEQDKHKKLSCHWQKLEKYFRMLRRAIKLGITITPLLLLYPLHHLLSLYHYIRGKNVTQLEDSTVLDWWVKLCMWSVERNGAALVKLLQVS